MFYLQQQSVIFHVKNFHGVSWSRDAASNYFFRWFICISKAWSSTWRNGHGVSWAVTKCQIITSDDVDQGRQWFKADAESAAWCFHWNFISWTNCSGSVVSDYGIEQKQRHQWFFVKVFEGESLVNQRRSINRGGIFLVFFLLQWPSWHPSQVWWAPVATEEGCYSLFSVAERQLRRDVKRFICTSKACFSTWQRFTAWAENECSHEKQKTFQWITIAKMMKFVHIVSFRKGWEM